MKKVIFSLLLVLGTTVVAQQKSIIIGVNGGLPTSALKDSHKFSAGVDVSYLFDFNIFGTDDQSQIGLTAGYIYYSPENDNVESKSYVPVAASVRFNSDEDKFFLGGDLGWAFAISPEGDRGGLYFKPIIGYNITRNIQVSAGYAIIKKRQTDFSNINLGLAYRF